VILSRIKSWARERRDPNRFLAKVSGVVHVGANSGQERDLYHKLGLKVIWVEPIPEVFNLLVANIKGYANQIAYRQLLTDKDEETHTLHLASNEGQSSSIYELEEHKDIWPYVNYTGSLQLKSKKLEALFSEEGINAKDYQALVMDTQGSELLVLKGAVSLLNGFKYVKTEVPDFESYKDCCQLKDIDDFMFSHGFKEHGRVEFATRKEGGSYFDIVYKRIRKVQVMGERNELRL